MGIDRGQTGRLKRQKSSSVVRAKRAKAPDDQTRQTDYESAPGPQVGRLASTKEKDAFSSLAGKIPSDFEKGEISENLNQFIEILKEWDSKKVDPDSN